MTDPAGPEWTSAAWSRHGWRIHAGAGGETGAAGGWADVADLWAGVADGWAGVAGTIPELAAASARRVPDRVAVSVDGQPVSHGQLDAAARRAAAWLAGRLGRGERMLLAAGPGPGFLHWYLGALRAGVVVVLANPGYTPAELGHLVTDSGARLAVADPGPARRLGTLAAGLPVVAAGDPPRDPPPGGGRALPAAGDIALLAYTSGTTGRPKGVPLTHRQLAASIQGAMAAWRWADGDVLVHALPLFHQHGLGGVHATLIAGSTAYLRSRFDPAGLIATVRAEGGTVLFGVPATYQALLDCAGGAPLLRGLRLAVCGSAPLSPALAARLPGLLGQLPLIRYGTTESGLDVSNPLGAARPDTVGLPLPGVECRIWSGGDEASGGKEARPGDEGEIQLRGPQVFRGYWNDAEATAAAFTPDGWFRTGDIGAIDPGPSPGSAPAPAPGSGPDLAPGPGSGSGLVPAPSPAPAPGPGSGPDLAPGSGSGSGSATGPGPGSGPGPGHLVIRGRIKELIISGGLNVYPREVEIALECHPSVAEAAVAGLPHPRWGEQVTAWVVPRAGATVSEAELIAHTRTLLAAYKCPKQVFPLAALPRTPVGKLARAALTRPPPAHPQP